MALFTTFARRRPLDQLSELDLSEGVRRALPPHFEAVAEALLTHGELLEACSTAGRRVARDGAALGEALSGLRATYQLVVARPPSFEAGEALSLAWSEATLEYLHQLSCEDPLTGLASIAHVRSRLDEIYREAEVTDVSVRNTHALVVVDLIFGDSAADPTSDPPHAFARALRLVQVTEAMRNVYSGGQTIGRLGLDRAVALVARRDDLGRSVAMLQELLEEIDLDGARLRVWVEGLPHGPDAATKLLDELAR